VYNKFTWVLHPTIMKPSIFKLFIVFNFFILDTNGQGIISNVCDSKLLTRQEYEKCKADSAWTADVINKTNYIINLKTDLLPKYRLLRRALKIPTILQASLQQLKITYDTVLNKKLFIFQTEMDRNQKYVQPKAYLSSLLSFQVLKFYPDIYAILLNNIHLHVTPQTTREQQKRYKQQFDKTLTLIPTDLYQELIKITNELNIDNNKLIENGAVRIFQGSIQDDYKSQSDVLNFLLWTE
jgi:hypothetical protein